MNSTEFFLECYHEVDICGFKCLDNYLTDYHKVWLSIASFDVEKE